MRDVGPTHRPRSRVHVQRPSLRSRPPLRTSRGRLEGPASQPVVPADGPQSGSRTPPSPRNQPTLRLQMFRESPTPTPTFQESQTRTGTTETTGKEPVVLVPTRSDVTAGYSPTPERLAPHESRWSREQNRARTTWKRRQFLTEPQTLRRRSSALFHRTSGTIKPARDS